jgi:hypothetical protein
MKDLMKALNENAVMKPVARGGHATEYEAGRHLWRRRAR